MPALSKPSTIIAEVGVGRAGSQTLKLTSLIYTNKHHHIWRHVVVSICHKGFMTVHVSAPHPPSHICLWMSSVRSQHVCTCINKQITNVHAIIPNNGEPTLAYNFILFVVDQQSIHHQCQNKTPNQAILLLDRCGFGDKIRLDFLLSSCRAGPHYGLVSIQDSPV
jgi:hypothetical protein